MKYYIPDCFWPEEDHGSYRSHEAICILNTGKEPVVATLTLYFEDREKMEGFQVTVPGERTAHVHMDHIKNRAGEGVPRGTGYAIVVETGEPVMVQYTRVDTTQPELAIATTMAVQR